MEVRAKRTGIMANEKANVAILELSDEDFPRYSSFRDKLRVLVPVCLLISFQQGLSQFGVILDNLAQYFPDASQTMIQMVVAAPSATAIPVSLCSGVLATFFPRKKIGLAALAIMLVGGLFPLFFHENIYCLFVSSGLIGVAQGLIITTSTGMFAENFYGKDRDFAMGLKQVTDSIGNTIIAVAVGQFCLIAWQLSYSVYVLIIPIIVLVAKYMPMGEPDAKIYSSKQGFKGIRFLLTPHYLFMCVFMMFCGLSAFGFYLNGSMSVAEKGLGDATLVSIVFSVQNVLTLVFGLAYMPIASVLKKYTLAVAMGVMCVAYAIFYLGDCVPAFILGGVVWGIGNSLVQSASLVYLANVVPKGGYGIGLAVGNAMINVGISFTPLVVNSLRGAVFGSQSPTDAFAVIAAFCLLAAVLETLREVLFVRMKASK